MKFFFERIIATFVLLVLAINGLFANATYGIKTHEQNIGFIENKGQIIDNNGALRPDILFTTQSKGVKVFIGKQGIHYQFCQRINQKKKSIISGNNKYLDGSEPNNISTYRLDVILENSNPNPKVIRKNPTGYYENYYLAHCPAGIKGVKSFEKIILVDVYPGIDWVFYRNGQFIKYDFVVNAGADPSLIKLNFNGAENIEINHDASLTIKTPFGFVHEGVPYSYKAITKKKIASSFVLKGNQLGFNIQSNGKEPIVIDPTLEWATYYGGSNDDNSSCISIDNAGNIYMAGSTRSATNISSGGFQDTLYGNTDAFLVKFDGSGTRIWATYFGGAGVDMANGCATDNVGNVFICGVTSSIGIAYNGHQNTNAGGYADCFLLKFDSSGYRIWSTYYGGSGREFCNSLYAFDNVIYMVGSTESTSGISTLGSFQSSKIGPYDDFLVKFSSNGSRIWGTYYGGTGYEHAYDCSVDSKGNVYMSGSTTSDTGIASNGHMNTYGGYWDAFLVKFDSSCNRIWSTYYGGNTQAQGSACTIDGSDNVYLTGYTSSTNGICINGHQSTLGGMKDAYLVKFDSSGVRLWGTYYGGLDDDLGYDCAVDENENVYITGITSSQDNISFGGIQNFLGDTSGTDDAFVACFNSAGVRLWGTYYGGPKRDEGWAIATDNNSCVYFAGTTKSTISISHLGHQNLFGGGINASDAFLGKICASSTGIETNPENLLIYPNPTTGSFTVVFKHYENYLNLKVKTILGKEMINNNYSYCQKVNLKIYKSGIYILETVNEHGNMMNGKVIVY